LSLLGTVRWIGQVARLRARLLLWWLRQWLEDRRLDRRRRALFSRLGEAVYRGDVPGGDGVRSELGEIERRLVEGRARLEREIEETLRREREARLASRRTAIIQRLPEPSPQPASLPSEPDPVAAPGSLAPEPARVREPGPPPEQDPEQAPTVEHASRRRRRRAEAEPGRPRPSPRRRSR
jgi:hypothetical protein